MRCRNLIATNDRIDVAMRQFSANSLRCLTEGHDGEDGLTPTARSRYDAGLPGMRPRGRDPRCRRCCQRDHGVSHSDEAHAAGALLACVPAAVWRHYGGWHVIHRPAFWSHPAVYPSRGWHSTAFWSAAEPGERATNQTHRRLAARLRIVRPSSTYSLIRSPRSVAYPSAAEVRSSALS
jgi:hypothetical protein